MVSSAILKVTVLFYRRTSVDGCQSLLPLGLTWWEADFRKQVGGSEPPPLPVKAGASQGSGHGMLDEGGYSQHWLAPGFKPDPLRADTVQMLLLRQFGGAQSSGLHDDQQLVHDEPQFVDAHRFFLWASLGVRRLLQ